ncbi:MAG: hypothetical protein ABL898_10955 [Hyphomicrobiaceae bacterium]|nr:hypothetical protein [Hyphomicrobiaceae bacterium]
MTRARQTDLLNCVVFGAGVLFAAFVPAFAQDATRGIVTTIDLKACKLVKKHADGNSWICKGLSAYPVYVAEGDLRFFVSVGVAPEKRRAAQQTLKPFNTLFPGKTTRTSIEWRVGGTSAARTPYATIIRYHTMRDEQGGQTQRGEVLVVSKVSAEETCHLAVIDALATPNAMEMARRIADERASPFSCKDDPKIEGQTGKSPM